MDILTKLSLKPIAEGVIEDVLIEDRMIHVALLGEDKWRVIDCYIDFCIWYEKNKAHEDEFSTDYDDDGSKQRILETKDWEFCTPEIFSEYARDVTKIYILRNDVMNIDLYELNNMLTAFQMSDKKNLPEDVNFLVQKIKYQCEGIYRKIGEK